MQVFRWGFMQSRNNWGSNYIWSMKPVNEQSGVILIHKVYYPYSYAQALGNKRKWVWTLATQRKILNSLTETSWVLVTVVQTQRPWSWEQRPSQVKEHRGYCPLPVFLNLLAPSETSWLQIASTMRDWSTNPGAGLATAPHSSWALENRCYGKSEGSHCRSKASHLGPTCRPGEWIS